MPYLILLGILISTTLWDFFPHSLLNKYEWISLALTPFPSNTSSSQDFPSSTIASSQQHPYLSPGFQKQLDTRTFSELTAFNHTTLLANSLSFQKRMKLVREAQHTIHLSIFSLVCDETGSTFANELIKATERGVDVRVIIDGSIMSSFNTHCFDTMRTKGIKVMRSHPYFFLNHATWNLHEKIQIIDGEKAVIGGQNIGDWWGKSTGIDGNFRDTDVYVEGPVVHQMEKHFIDLWSKKDPTNFYMKNLKTFVEQKILQDRVEKKIGQANYEEWLKHPKGLCRFVYQDPQQNNYNVVKAYQEHIKEAQKHIIIEATTFHSYGNDLQKSLNQSLFDFMHHKKGRVDVLTNGSGFTHSHTMSAFIGAFFSWYFLNDLYNSVINTAIHLHLYKTLFHSKVHYFDHLAVGIGSFNFDETSSLWQENTLICMEPELVNQVEALLKLDFQNSYNVANPAT